MIERILPAGVASAEAFADPPDAALFPEEAALVAKAVEKRRREFATARGCARGALAALGVPPAPILRGERGAPQWPPGIVGSITHCAGYRAAVVARGRDALTIGVDAEPDEGLPRGVLDAVSLPGERARLRDLAAALPHTSWDRLLFSAKEAVYKAWFPLTRRWLGFDEADITISPADGSFSARLLVAASVVGNAPLACLTGRWLACDGLILTAITVPALRFGGLPQEGPVLDHPGRGAGPPGERPERGRVVRLRGNPGLGRLGSAVTNHDLDHPIDDDAPIGRGQFVPVKEEPQLSSADGRLGCGRAPLDVVAELGLPRGGPGHLVKARDRPGGIPVEECHGMVRSGERVPGARVTVADDGVRPFMTQPPGLPYGVWRRPEIGGRPVQIAQQPADFPDSLVRPGMRIGDRALDIAQGLVAAIVESRVGDPRTSRKSGPFQVRQKGMDGNAPRPPRPQDNFPTAGHGARRAINAWQEFIGRVHMHTGLH
jgi:4'-phosphopantetheinyl transferase EntD